MPPRSNGGHPGLSVEECAFFVIPAAIAALALAGCTVGDDGPRTSQTRDVADFTRIDNHDSVDVRLHVGEPQRVRSAPARR